MLAAFAGRVTRGRAAGSAAAETVRLSANLQPSSEVPPTATKPGRRRGHLRHGHAHAAVEGHLRTPHGAGHRRALPRAGAGRPERGRAGADPEGELAADQPKELTDAQVTDLMGGKWYFNVHTKEHPAGEIRGQVMPAN